MAREKTGKKACCSEAGFKEAVRKKAQELYEKSGRKPGCDLDNWLKAEKIVKAQLCGSRQRISC